MCFFPCWFLGWDVGFDCISISFLLYKLSVFLLLLLPFKSFRAQKKSHLELSIRAMSE